MVKITDIKNLTNAWHLRKIRDVSEGHVARLNVCNDGLYFHNNKGTDTLFGIPGLHDERPLGRCLISTDQA